MSRSIVAVLVTLSIAPFATAKVIKVSKGGPISTISDGVAAASAGDTILVKAGVYHEAVVVPPGKDGLEFESDGRVVVDGRGPAGIPLGPGFKVQSANVTIDGFVIQNREHDAMSEGAGVIGSQPGLVIVDCEFRACEARPIYCSAGNGNKVLDTRIFVCDDDGIEITGDDVTIRRVRTSHTAGIAIEVIGMRASVTKCSVLMGKENGIRITGPDGRVLDCEVECVTLDAIEVNGPNGIVRDCEIRGTTGSGISVDSTSGRVENNEIVDCSTDGIRGNGEELVIRNNRIEGIDDNYGIYSGNNGQTVTGNRISRVYRTGYGIGVGGSNSRVAGNSVEAATSFGIELENDTTNVVVEGNVVTDCGHVGENGFLIRGNGHTIKNNVARRSGRDGFNVFGNSITLVGNKSFDNGEDGIDVEGGVGVIVDKNQAKGNTAEGIENNATGTTITDNKASKNRIDFANSGAGVTFTGNHSGDGSDASTLPEIDN